MWFTSIWLLCTDKYNCSKDKNNDKSASIIIFHYFCGWATTGINDRQWWIHWIHIKVPMCVCVYKLAIWPLHHYSITQWFSQSCSLIRDLFFRPHYAAPFTSTLNPNLSYTALIPEIILHMIRSSKGCWAISKHTILLYLCICISS